MYYYLFEYSVVDIVFSQPAIILIKLKGSTFMIHLFINQLLWPNSLTFQYSRTPLK